MISYLTIVPSVYLVGQSQTGLYYSAEGRSHLVRDIWDPNECVIDPLLLGIKLTLLLVLSLWDIRIADSTALRFLNTIIFLLTVRKIVVHFLNIDTTRWFTLELYILTLDLVQLHLIAQLSLNTKYLLLERILNCPVLTEPFLLFLKSIEDVYQADLFSGYSIIAISTRMLRLYFKHHFIDLMHLSCLFLLPIFELLHAVEWDEDFFGVNLVFKMIFIAFTLFAVQLVSRLVLGLIKLL